MAENLKENVLPRTLSDLVGDFADLFQKEVSLAKAELSEKLSLKLRAGIWMSAAGVFGLMTLFLVLQAFVYGLAAYGLAMHWSALIVAGGCAVIAFAAFFKGKADAAEELTPTRTIHNVRQDIATAKEQLS